tara:strand:+ start:31911 stop:34721 length:2811 start_codon:yes stop_codon:yes gene_type:complete
MNKFYNYALGVLSFVVMSISTVNAQSCDTLRNYNPADDFWQLTSGANDFILGHETSLSDGTDFYDANYWSEQYNVTAATEVRALRFAPWNVDDQGTVDSIAFIVWGDDAGNPGFPDLNNELGKQWMRYDEMTEGQFNLLEFDTPVPVNGLFHVGYELNYDATQDTFALLGTQPATNYTNFQIIEPGAALDGTWFGVDDVYTDGGGAPLNTAFVLDVLTSNATAPTADFSITPASGAVCFGTDFQVDGSATTGSVDVYDWYLTDQAVTTIYDNDNTSGVNASLTPTTSPSTQTIFLIADGACVSDIVGYLVDVYDPVSATVGTTDPTCGNNNGEIDITGAAGGDGTYTYEITDGGGNTTSQGNGSFTGLAPGSYDISVSTVGGGCEFTQTVTLTAIPPETVTAGADDAICNGSSFNLTATGNGSLEWFDGGGNSVGTGSPLSVSPTTTTTYDVVLTDANGCTDTDQLQVTVNPVNDATFTYSSNTICLTGGNETPTINGTGTFTSTPAGLVFADAATGEIDVSNSNAGSYDVTFTTTGTCGETETQTVTLTTSPDATFSYSAAEFCAEVGTEAPTFPTGASAGTFTATPTGLSLNGSTGEITLDGSTANTYTVTNTIAASGSCPQTSATATVTINALPTVNGGADDVVCEGTQVTLTATGADTYSWTGGISQGTPFTPTVGTNTYTVTGTDANNCENTDDVVITVDEEPVLDAGADQEVCEGTEVTLTATNTVGTVTWDNGITDGTPFTPTATATYTATATNGECVVTDEAIVTVNALPTVTTGADETTCVNYAPIQLTGTPTGGTFSGTGVTGSEFDPGTAGVGTYTITYTYTDGNGCENSATQEITVDGCASIEENALDAIIVAPNPATTFVDISVNANDLNAIQLMNATGQIMNVSIVNEANKTRVDLENVAKGTYFLQINTVNGQTTKKLIVQ